VWIKLKKMGSVVLSFALLLLSGCGGGPKLAPTTRQIVVHINAPKLDVFDSLSLVVMKHGFSIINSNERLGLITTDYKEVNESIGSGLLLSMFGKKKPEMQLTTNISTKDNISVLTISPKGRVRQKKGSYYDEIQFGDSLVSFIEGMGREVKELAESKR
jgi:hypothetical protein